MHIPLSSLNRIDKPQNHRGISGIRELSKNHGPHPPTSVASQKKPSCTTSYVEISVLACQQRKSEASTDLATRPLSTVNLRST